ncbi:MAG: class I SAM-dependent methyltransferase [Desulfosporosinus sp.]|nr:class I SAM-dependent methyltransferase [Desulfosporosinus sp.]
MIDYRNIDLISAFKEYLDNFCYDAIYQILSGEINYLYNPWQAYEALNTSLLGLERKKQTVFKLLLLGQQININEAIEDMGETIVKILADLGVIIVDNGLIRTDGYSLLSFCDHYFLVGLPYFYPTNIEKDPAVYIGVDTYRLVRLLPSKKVNSMLDLCTGSGIQAILGSRSANNVIGVEINNQASAVTKFNVNLNNLQNKINIIEGNLYEPVIGKTFDVITANPPFIPVPENIKYSIAGDGG